MYRAYLVNTQSLTPDDRRKALDLLESSCDTHSMLGSNPKVYLALTTWSPDAFEVLAFPDGCTITDVTGHDLLQYR